MTIPVPLILTTVSLFEKIARDQFRAGERKTELLQIRAKIDHDAAVAADTHKVEMQRIENADQHSERQKTIMLRIIDAIERQNEKRLETILAVFRDTRDILKLHQSILAQEKQELLRHSLTTNITPVQHVRLLQRQSEIDTDLGEIDFNMCQLASRAMILIKSCEPGLPTSQIAMLTQDIQ